MAKRVVISNSDIRMFKRCRRRWEYLSKLRKGLKIKRIDTKLSLGVGIHVALSAYYSHYNKGEHSLEVLLSSFAGWYTKEKARLEELEVFEEQKSEMFELYEFGKEILTGYASWAAKYDSKDFTKVLYNEERIDIPIRNPNGKRTCGTYSFKADLIVEDKDGFLWLTDHKTIATANIPSLELDEQAVSYLYGAQKKLKIKIEGVIFNFLIKKLPSVPESLKNGELSKKKIATTYDVYLDAIKKHYNFEEKEEKEKIEILLPYKEILEELQNQENPFFKREKVYKSQSEIEEIGRRLYYEYKEMRNPKINIFPNPTRDCSWDCGLRTLCIVENDDGDVKSLIDDIFESKEKGKKETSFVIVSEDSPEEEV